MLHTADKRRARKLLYVELLPCRGVMKVVVAVDAWKSSSAHETEVTVEGGQKVVRLSHALKFYLFLDNALQRLPVKDAEPTLPSVCASSRVDWYALVDGALPHGSSPPLAIVEPIPAPRGR